MFFEYFIQKLRKQHKIVCTSRKYQQVNGIERFGSINPVIVGKHGGKNNVNKLLASLNRSKLLTKKIEKDKKKDIHINILDSKLIKSKKLYGFDNNKLHKFVQLK